jgi:hypothetical protein
MGYSGLFSLQTPQDLLAKARHDIARLRTSPLDPYAAFDFFVAVRHLPDWLHPKDKDKAKRSALFKNHVELRIARHIADGAKHFEATRNHHLQVAGTSTSPGAFQRGAYQADAFQIGGLIVELDARDADTLAIGTRVDALSLAEKVLLVAEAIVV